MFEVPFKSVSFLGGQPRNGFHKMNAESLKNERNVGSNTMLERPAFPRVNVSAMTFKSWKPQF